MNNKTMMNLKAFVVFHKIIYPELYIDLYGKQYLTLYGVKETLNEKPPLDVLYEKDMSIYEPIWQKLHYNEASALYHIYKNRIHEQYDYVGFFQYDMVFSHDCFSVIEQQCTERTVFCVLFFGSEDIILSEQADIHKRVVNALFIEGLQSYNAFFGTTFTLDTLNTYKVPKLNSFIIHKRMFEKLMNWMSRYYVDNFDLVELMRNKPNSNPGYLIECCTGLFLCLEVAQGLAEYKIMDTFIEHSDTLKLPNQEKRYMMT